MIEAQKDRYRRIIRKSVGSLGEDDSDARDAVFQKLRAANEELLQRKSIDLNSETANALRSALEQVIAEEGGTPRPVRSPKELETGSIASDESGMDRKPSRQRNSDRRSAFVATLVVVSALFGALVGVFGPPLISGSGFMPLTDGDAPEGLNAAFVQAYNTNLPQVAVAASFLERVRDDIVKRQKSDPSGLSGLAGKTFVALEKVNPQLAAEMPKTLPKGSAMLIRADATDYKILFNWPLCGTVQFAKPELVDPARKIDGLGCSFFGVWTTGAVTW